MRSAFLLLDAQRWVFAAESPIHDSTRLRSRLRELLEAARSKHVFVAMVRGPASPNSDASWFELDDAFAPRPGEFVVDRVVPDAFEETELGHDLLEAGVGRLIVAGVRSDECVHASVRRAIDLGFDVVLVADAHSTAASGTHGAEEISASVNAKLALEVSVVPGASVEW